MEWEIITKNGRPTDEQIDTVGNIYQKSGGVIPKACQKCKEEFKSEVRDDALTQPVPGYKCESCTFESAAGDSALDHKLEHIDHNIKKIRKERIVSIERHLFGRMSYIEKTQNDVIILCEKCK